MLRFRLIVVLVLGLPVACALSPQTVTLTPRVDAPAPDIGRGRILTLEVVDARPTQAFGSRGGVYNTALITPRAPVEGVIWEALAERLRAGGFQVVGGDQPAPLGLTATVESLDYRAWGQPVVNRVQLEARIRTQARNGGRQLSGRYHATLNQPVLKAPDEATNERLINQVLGDALARLLRDQALVELLAAPTGGV